MSFSSKRIPLIASKLEPSRITHQPMAPPQSRAGARIRAFFSETGGRLDAAFNPKLDMKAYGQSKRTSDQVRAAVRLTKTNAWFIYHYSISSQNMRSEPLPPCNAIRLFPL